MDRVSRRTADASDATPAVVIRQAERAARPADWRIVDAGRPVAEVLAEVERELGASP